MVDLDKMNMNCLFSKDDKEGKQLFKNIIKNKVRLDKLANGRPK